MIFHNVFRHVEHSKGLPQFIVNLIKLLAPMNYEPKDTQVRFVVLFALLPLYLHSNIRFYHQNPANRIRISKSCYWLFAGTANTVILFSACHCTDFVVLLHFILHFCLKISASIFCSLEHEQFVLSSRFFSQHSLLSLESVWQKSLFFSSNQSVGLLVFRWKRILAHSQTL